jgi:hypothetical protein
MWCTSTRLVTGILFRASSCEGSGWLWKFWQLATLKSSPKDHSLAALRRVILAGLENCVIDLIPKVRQRPIDESIQSS